MAPALRPEDGARAVRLARAAAEEVVLRKRPARRDFDGAFREPRGAFVTFTLGPQLRGCCGFAEPVMPLGATLADGAQGAVRDPRFDPVRPREWPALRASVSVLGPLQPLRAAPEELPQRILLGDHGLVVQRGRNRGLLLPEVPVQHGMTAEEFLAATCIKAGLPGEAWRQRDGLAWHTFEAQVFEEVAPSGAIEERSRARPELG